MYHYRLDDYKIREEIDKLKTWLDVDSLSKKLEYIASDREEVAANLDRLEAAVRAQIEVAKATRVVSMVFIERKVNYSNQIEYFVWWSDVPEHITQDIRFPFNMSDFCFPCGQRKDFPGMEHREAMKYAKALAEERAAEVVKMRF